MNYLLPNYWIAKEHKIIAALKPISKHQENLKDKIAFLSLKTNYLE